MFRSARIKLTAWYLLIILFVSASFSLVIYKELTSEVERFARIQRIRIERRLQEGSFIPPDFNMQRLVPPLSMDPELVEDTKRRLLLILISVNGAIFVISGGLGYFLAGQTLKPIKDIMDEQNRFVSDASHELRTPLTVLKSSMEVALRDKKLTVVEAKKFMGENVVQVDSLQTLSDSLLALMQYHQQNSRSALKTISSTEIANDVLKRVAPLANAKTIHIHTEVREITCKVNEESIGNLLVLLLDNAIKYSNEKSGVTLGMKRIDGQIKMWVKDQGIGISKEDLPHIFDRFYRADSARARPHSGGYGLGLSIAKKIVERHHGSITVDSTPNKGSTFTVFLPG